MKIGIVTFIKACNYGAVLQNYALQKHLKSLGHEVVCLDVPLPAAREGFRTKLRMFFVKRVFRKFSRRHLPNRVPVDRKIDLCVFGSDQIWNVDITKECYEVYFGKGIKCEKKISYAASFGLSHWKFDGITDEVRRLLSSFDGISVRESSGVDICKQKLNSHAVQVLDPTFLVRDYSELLVETPKIDIACYIFNKLNNSVDKIKSIGVKYNKRVTVLNDFRIRRGITSVPYPSVNRWLSSINNSQLVITDSFHCMVYAIIFRKQFIALPAIRERSGRMTSLLSALDLGERFFESIEDVLCSDIATENIDYSKVELKLANLRDESLQFFSDMNL